MVPAAVTGILLLLILTLAAGVVAREDKRTAHPEAIQDPCAFFRDCERRLDFRDMGALSAVCPSTGDLGQFTLRFNGVDNYYDDSTSMWFYVLEWDGEDPGMDEFILGLGGCIVRATFISGCPAGYVVEMDAGSGIYGVKWTSAPQIPELHFSFLLDGIFPVGSQPFAVKAGGQMAIGSICAPICDTQCTLEIECPSDITVTCNEPIDPPITGFPVIRGNCPPFDTTYADEVLQDECPYVVQRTWTVTDASGLVAACVQMIIAVDTTPPVITCPPDVDYECDDIGPFGEATAVDNCDPNPVVSYVDSVIFYRCPWEYTKKRTWTATDACGNSSSCAQIIDIHDGGPPVITYCPPDVTVACEDEIDWEDMAEAEDTCNPELEMSYEFGRAADQDPCEYIIIRGWEFTDGCCNKVYCHQTITVKDTVPPVLTCAEDDTIACEAAVIFTDPDIVDNCDLPATFTVISTDTVTGPEPWDYTYTRCWEGVDACANKDTCCQRIRELCDYGTCSYTQGGWGSGCPDSQQGDSMSTQPGCIRDHYFDMVFPEGVMIGDTTGIDGFGAVWETAAAVEAFLPAGGTPGALSGDLMNPMDTPAGILAGQLLALRMNREFSCEGVFDILGLLLEVDCYGEFMIPARCGIFAGLTVDEFLEIADQAVAGDMSVLDPYYADLSDVNQTATCLNELYDECEMPEDPEAEPRIQVIIAPTPEDQVTPEEVGDDVLIPADVRVSSHPNPLTGSTTISYSLPVGGRVTVEVYDINGRRMATLVDARKSAGSHGIVWNGKDGIGNTAASGVYFCRVRLENHPTVMEKLIKI
jgi:hypothetical protein